MRTLTIMLALACGLAALAGCTTHPAPHSADAPTALSADQTNEQLQPALEREFPLRTTRTRVLERAKGLGLEFVQQARLVDAQGRDVPFKDITATQEEYAARGFHIETTDFPDPQHIAFQFPTPNSDQSDGPETISRAMMFVFDRDGRLRGISVSPAMGSKPNRMVHAGFGIGDPKQAGDH